MVHKPNLQENSQSNNLQVTDQRSKQEHSDSADLHQGISINGQNPP